MPNFISQVRIFINVCIIDIEFYVNVGLCSPSNLLLEYSARILMSTYYPSTRLITN